MDKQYLTIRQAARELQVPECYIRREENAGRVPGFKSGSRVYVDILAFRDVLSRDNLRANVQ